MKFSLYQFNPIWEDKLGNQQKIADCLEKFNLDTDVLIFPEMSLTGFTMRSQRFSEPINGGSVKFFQSIAKERNMHVLAGIIEKENGKYFNTLVHINRIGELNAKYQKIHPFSFSGENRHYDAGENVVIIKIDNLQIGLSICYDLRFPELFRHFGKNRVDAIINIANWPVDRIEHWQHLLKARAIENLSYMIGVNRIGKDKGNEYNGQSFIFGPLGQNIIHLNNSDKIKTVELDFNLVKQARETFPFLDDIKLL